MIPEDVEDEIDSGEEIIYQYVVEDDLYRKGRYAMLASLFFAVPINYLTKYDIGYLASELNEFHQWGVYPTYSVILIILIVMILAFIRMNRTDRFFLTNKRIIVQNDFKIYSVVSMIKYENIISISERKKYLRSKEHCLDIEAHRGLNPSKRRGMRMYTDNNRDKVLELIEEMRQSPTAESVGLSVDTQSSEK